MAASQITIGVTNPENGTIAFSDSSDFIVNPLAVEVGTAVAVAYRADETPIGEGGTIDENTEFYYLITITNTTVDPNAQEISLGNMTITNLKSMELSKVEGSTDNLIYTEIAVSEGVYPLTSLNTVASQAAVYVKISGTAKIDTPVE